MSCFQRRAAFHAMAIIGGLAVATPAFASTAGPATLNVNATVTAACTATTDPVSFGNVDLTPGTAINGSGTLTVTCTKGTGWTATADAGEGSGASFATRTMTADDASGNTLNYTLYTASDRATVWGDGTGGTSGTITGTGTGVSDPETIYASILSSQTAPAGGYTDHVNVTITY